MDVQPLEGLHSQSQSWNKGCWDELYKQGGSQIKTNWTKYTCRLLTETVLSVLVLMGIHLNASLLRLSSDWQCFPLERSLDLVRLVSDLRLCLLQVSVGCRWPHSSLHTYWEKTGRSPLAMILVFPKCKLGFFQIHVSLMSLWIIFYNLIVCSSKAEDRKTKENPSTLGYTSSQANCSRSLGIVSVTGHLWSC